MSEDRCICCGSIIPEGQQVCPLCQKEATEKMQVAKWGKKSMDIFDYLMKDWIIPLGIGAFIIWVIIEISKL